eukprot:jgi/Hompol1/931/HPOL_003400-RA
MSAVSGHPDHLAASRGNTLAQAAAARPDSSNKEPAKQLTEHTQQQQQQQQQHEQQEEQRLKDISLEIVTEHLGFAPIHFIDEFMNSVNAQLYSAMETLETLVAAELGRGIETERNLDLTITAQQEQQLDYEHSEMRTKLAAIREHEQFLDDAINQLTILSSQLADLDAIAMTVQAWDVSREYRDAMAIGSIKEITAFKDTVLMPLSN